MSQQLFLRDDIIEFTNKLDSECYNVKAYRKRKSKSKKITLLGATTVDINKSQEQMSNINKFSNRTQLNFNQSTQRRISMTACMKQRSKHSQSFRNNNRSINIRTQINNHKKQDQNQIKIAKTNYTPIQNNFHQNKIHNETIPQAQSIKESNQVNNHSNTKYNEIEQQFHKKGPANDKVIQNWLNQILMQYCHEQSFDKSIQNSALKKMSLDRNSLLSQGIKPQYVSRVYKSMFVYSIGFNNLLKELSGKNTNLKKTIWKVYAILLQFCSQGSFQTMIGQIERDKVKKIQSLRQQIQKRQRIIQNNDQINAQKNARIFKQLKVLRQQNINLQNQKNVLMQDFKQAEQSFNHQVSLRLKFQNKINQIHGIHNELANKHARLYDDYNKKTKQFQILQYKFNELNNKYLIKKDKLNRTLQELQLKCQQNQKNKEIIAKYQQMRLRYQNSQIQLKNSKQDLQNIIKQKARKISQLQIQRQNSQIMLNLNKQSSNQIQSLYKQSLNDNRKLHGTIRQQVVQINQLFSEKRSFNEKHLSYIAQIQFLKNKDSQNKITIQRNKKQIKQQKQKIQNLQVQKLTLNKKLQNINKDLQNCYQSIQNMKRTKNIYQEQLAYFKKRSQVHGQVVRQKQNLINKYSKQSQRYIKQNQQLLTIKKTLDSRVMILTQKMSSQEQINKKKVQKLRQQRDILLKQNSFHNQILEQKISQLQKYMNLYDKETINLKNQRFQRVNLDLRYKQSLQVMESQNQHIKGLNIKISQNYQEIQELKRKYRNLQYILKQKQHLFQIQKNSLKQYLQKLKEQVMKKKMYLNPMLLQDLKGLLKRALQKNHQYQQNFVSFNKKYITQNKTLLNQLKQTKQHYISLLKQQQLKYNKIIFDRQDQLSFQKQKSKHLIEKNNQYQRIIEKNKINQNQNNSSVLNKEKQRKYLSTIKQKAQHIQKLLKQLQSAHDNNNTLIKRINQIQVILSEKNNQISQLDNKLTKFMQQNHSSNNQKNINRIKQTINSNNNEDNYQGNLQSIMNNQKNSMTNSNKKKDYIDSKRQTSSNNKLSSKQQTQSKQEFDEENKKINKNQKNQKVVNPVWRNDFSKKFKNAFNYYKH